MKRTKLYKYIGKNGTIVSPVLLEGINHILLYKLEADENKILTDGIEKTKFITIFKEELEEWVEIDNI